jgi:hypothetical protein
MLLFCLSCNKTSRLGFALEAAKQNRGEIEKILNHYSVLEDSLKLKAAIFLIENMPGHYSYADTERFNQYLNELDSIADNYNSLNRSELENLFAEVYHKHGINYNMARIPDIEIITADYLIDNIEQSFDVWQNAEWAQHLSFDDFCEYILPYKVMEGQMLDNWREYSRELFGERIVITKHSTLVGQSAAMVCDIVTRNMRQVIHPHVTYEVGFPINRIRTFLKIPSGTCDDYAVMALAVMRSKGIPTAIDYTPQWPFRSMGHSWNVLLENTGKMGIFESAGTDVGTPHKKDHKMAKVYRKTYAANKEIEQIHQAENSVPDFIETPFMKDVTDEYMITGDVTVSLKSRPTFRYAYLAVFDNANWVPISWGKVQRRSVTFEKMGRDVAYLPVKYTQHRRGTEAIGNPFILTKRGEVRELKPDTLRRETLKLYRKYPVLPPAFQVGISRIVRAEIQASNTPDFSEPMTVHRYDDFDREVYVDTLSQKYRYWRFLSAPRGFVSVAELAFWERNAQQPAQGEIIGTDGSSGFAKESAFDGDLLTYFSATEHSGGWVGMDFGKPVDISRITCIMRGDGNDIEVGHNYELMYWENGDWQSLGKQTATDVFLMYENSPTNALFLLRNHTKGREERIFTYENGKQVWW